MSARSFSSASSFTLMLIALCCSRGEGEEKMYRCNSEEEEKRKRRGCGEVKNIR